MCGLCGFARHPDAPNLDQVKVVFDLLLLRNEKRGHHATGVAAVGGEKPFLLKRAVEASKFVKSTPYNEAMTALASDTPVLIGHTRHATHNNAHVDDAAHPFQMGKVVGAHNGMIYNWRELEAKHRAKHDPAWCNDSQAPFYLLNDCKNPVKALDALDGWWALTWTRGEFLYVCRTQQIELSGAYVPALRTLFWSSERRVLEETLKTCFGPEAGIEVWNFKSHEVYRYDPSKFDENGTGVQTMTAPFRGIGGQRRNTRVNSARPNEVKGGYSTTTTATASVAPYAETTGSTSLIKTGRGGARIMSMADIDTNIDQLWRLVRGLGRRLVALEKENAGLRMALDEAFPGMADDALGYADQVDPRQLGLPIDLDTRRDEGDPCTFTCNECGDGLEKGSLLAVPAGGFVHETCVLTEGETVARRHE